MLWPSGLRRDVKAVVYCRRGFESHQHQFFSSILFVMSKGMISTHGLSIHMEMSWNPSILECEVGLSGKSIYLQQVFCLDCE